MQHTAKVSGTVTPWGVGGTSGKHGAGAQVGAEQRLAADCLQRRSRFQARLSTSAEIVKNRPDTVGQPLQSSRSTFSWGSFLSFFAFQEGMLDTQISAPGGWPTVSAR